MICNFYQNHSRSTLHHIIYWRWYAVFATSRQFSLAKTFRHSFEWGKICWNPSTWSLLRAHSIEFIAQSGSRILHSYSLVLTSCMNRKQTSKRECVHAKVCLAFAVHESYLVYNSVHHFQYHRLVWVNILAYYKPSYSTRVLQQTTQKQHVWPSWRSVSDIYSHEWITWMAWDLFLSAQFNHQHIIGNLSGRVL